MMKTKTEIRNPKTKKEKFENPKRGLILLGNRKRAI